MTPEQLQSHWKHVKRGTTYTILTATNLHIYDMLGVLTDMDPVFIYQNKADRSYVFRCSTFKSSTISNMHWYLGKATVQTDKPLWQVTPIVLYRCKYDGSLWLRPESEFLDGRFMQLKQEESK